MKKREVLVVDDDPTNLRYIHEILKDEYKIYLAPSGERALRFMEGRIPNLILLDVAMPHMDGYEVMRRIKGREALGGVPVIFLTGMEGREREQEALELGAVDYILKPISAGIVKARVGLHIELESYRKDLESVVATRTAQLATTQDVILNVMANMTSIRDNETGSHITRTTFYVQLLVDNLRTLDVPGYRLGEEYALDIVKSARLHDIGKVAVPDNVLLKPARLSQLEFDRIKQHTVYGAQILDNAMRELGETASFLRVAREIIISHHEKWNGAGYPRGLRGSAIPLSGRIMAIADVYDALISRRPYKPCFGHDVAVSTIVEDAGTHFDPYLIEMSREVMEQFEAIAKEFRDEPYAI